MRDHAFDFKRGHALHQLVIRARDTGIGRIKQVLCWGSLVVILLTAGCTSETLFQSSFDANATNQPPSRTQAVGIVNVDGPAGSVLVVAAPVLPSGKWVQISHPSGPLVCAMQGNVSQFRGDGTYVFSTVLFIPTGSGAATVQFEQFGQAVTNYSGFLHLDFMPDNHVRIDDDPSTTFGTFARDQPFIVQVALTINASPSAQIVLSGAGASGQAKRDVIPRLRGMARQFGAARMWMGFPWTGSFDATNIVITKSQ